MFCVVWLSMTGPEPALCMRFKIQLAGNLGRQTFSFWLNGHIFCLSRRQTVWLNGCIFCLNGDRQFDSMVKDLASKGQLTTSSVRLFLFVSTVVYSASTGDRQFDSTVQDSASTNLILSLEAIYFNDRSVFYSPYTNISEGGNLLKRQVSLSGNCLLRSARRNRFLHTFIGEQATTDRILRQTNSWKTPVVLEIYHWSWTGRDLDEYFPEN